MLHDSIVSMERHGAPMDRRWIVTKLVHSIDLKVICLSVLLLLRAVLRPTTAMASRFTRVLDSCTGAASSSIAHHCTARQCIVDSVWEVGLWCWQGFLKTWVPPSGAFLIGTRQQIVRFLRQQCCSVTCGSCSLVQVHCFAQAASFNVPGTRITKRLSNS